MNLTNEEWLEIKDWLNELYVYFKNEYETLEFGRHAEYCGREARKIKAFLESKSK